MAGSPSPPSPAAPRNRRRGLLFRGTAVLLAMVGTLLLLEGGLRAYASLTHQGLGMGFDPELGWRPLPNVKKKGTLWGVNRPAVMNSKGWRDAERPYQKPPGVRRAVVLGDSMVFGVGVDDGERLTEKLSERLPRWEVLNLGVGAYGTDQELRVLEIEGVRYEPDVVVLVVFVGNDLDDIGYEWKDRWPKPFYTLQGGELVLTKPQPRWRLSVRLSSYLVEYLSQQMRPYYNDSRRAPGWATTDPVALFAAIVRRMAAECARRGAHFLVVLSYDAQLLWMPPVAEERRRRILAALEQAGIATLDTRSSSFALRYRRGEDLYHTDEVHWNVRGHEVVAEDLHEVLTAKGWLN